MKERSRNILGLTILLCVQLVVFVAGAGTVNAGTNRWTAAGPSNRSVSSFAAYTTSSATVVYAATGSGVFKNWTTVGGDTLSAEVKAVATSQKSPDTVFAATAAGLWKSSDGGALWTTSVTSTNIKSLAVNQATPDVVYAGTDNGVIKSDDAGLNWGAPSLAGNVINAIAIDPVTPGNIFAVASSGHVFTSSDGGATWTDHAIDNGIEGYAGAFDPTRPIRIFVGTSNGVYVSDDGGTLWTNAGLTGLSVNSVLVDPADSNTVYAGTALNGVFVKTAAATAWKAINSGLPFETTYPGVSALLADPRNHAHLYAGTINMGAYESAASAGITITPDPVTFTSINPRTDYFQRLTITNSGMADMTIDGWNNTGANATDFSLFPVTGGCDSYTPTLAPGDSCEVDLGVFVNYVGGVLSRSATLQFTYNNTDTPLKEVALTATVNDPAPSGTLRINSDNEWTNTRSVTLSITGVTSLYHHANGMRFSNSTGGPWSAWQPLAASKAWTLDEGDGTKTVYVQFKDDRGGWNDGLVATTYYQDTIKLDTTPPTTTIGDKPALQSNLVSGTISFTADETGSTFECSIDGGAFAACTNPASYSSLADGSHTFSVRATDPAGNLNSTPTQYTWTVDTLPPDTSITGQPADPTESGSATFSFTATETSTYQCSLDSGPYVACSSPYAISGLSYGSHTFDVRATDAAGNTDASPAHYVWNADPSTMAVITNGGSPVYTYTSIATAYGDAVIGGNQSIYLKPLNYGDVTFDKNVIVYLKGGYGPMYATHESGESTLGSMTISGATGKVVVYYNIAIQ